MTIDHRPEGTVSDTNPSFSVSILIDGAELNGRRTEIGTGTVAASELTQPVAPPAEPYSAQARVPALNWRQPLASEVQQLAVQRDAGTTVAVRRVPEKLLAPFGALRENLPVHMLRKRCGSTDSRRGTQDLAVFVKEACGGDRRESDLVIGGIRINRAGLDTVTVDPRSRLRIGLHLDDWSALHLSGRSLAPNRVSVNLGAQDPQGRGVHRPPLRQTVTFCSYRSRSGGSLKPCGKAPSSVGRRSSQ